MILSYERGDIVDTVEFDVTLRETFSAEADVPTRPVEAGADIADHVVPGPQRFSCTVVVSDTPVIQPATQMYGVVGTVEQQEIALGAIPRMRRGARGDNGGTAAEYERASASARVSTLQWSEAFSRVERVLDLLDTIRREALRCTAITTVREVADLFITRINAPRVLTKSIELTLEFVQVRVAESRTVDVPEPEEPRARPLSNAGRQRTTEVTDAVTQERATSALLALVQQAGGA
jgi:hypothetical protein